MEWDVAVRKARVLMRGFLDLPLIEDAGLMARELRELRTQVTRAIVALEEKRVGMAPGAELAALAKLEAGFRAEERAELNARTSGGEVCSTGSGS